jgi:hypothetical protein
MTRVMKLHVRNDSDDGNRSHGHSTLYPPHLDDKAAMHNI